MHISQLINYYPKHKYLDDVVSATGKKNINLFIDLKGCGQSLYQEWAVRFLIDQSQGQMFDHSVFSSVLEFISFHKNYARRRDINLRMFFFLESGVSHYHNKVHSIYKSNRNTKSKLFTELGEQNERLFRAVLDRNYHVISKVIPRIPGVYCTHLEFMEADFVPYYLRKYVLQDESYTDIVYSADKDMLQCMYNDNIFQYYKHYKKVAMLDQHTLWNHFLKLPEDEKYPCHPTYFPMALAIGGDEGDGFKGVKSIGAAWLKRMLPIVEKCTGSIEDIYDNVEAGKSIFCNPEPNDLTAPQWKRLETIRKNEDVVVRNLRLASYELLSRYVNETYPLDRIKMKKHIESSVTDENKIKSGRVLHAALDNAGLMPVIQEQTIYNLFM